MSVYKRLEISLQTRFKIMELMVIRNGSKQIISISGLGLLQIVSKLDTENAIFANGELEQLQMISRHRERYIC